MNFFPFDLETESVFLLNLGIRHPDNINEGIQEFL